MWIHYILNLQEFYKCAYTFVSNKKQYTFVNYLFMYFSMYFMLHNMFPDYLSEISLEFNENVWLFSKINPVSKLLYTVVWLFMLEYHVHFKNDNLEKMGPKISVCIVQYLFINFPRPTL